MSDSEDLGAQLERVEARVAASEAVQQLDWQPSREDATYLRNAYASGGEAAMNRLSDRLKQDHVQRYRSPGGATASATASAPTVDTRDATKWSADYVARLRDEGKLLSEVEKFRGTLPGGTGGLFRKRAQR